MTTKTPDWLTTSFADGIDERETRFEGHVRGVGCWLADRDPLRRPCSGRLERFHFIGRQRVRHALGALLPWGPAGTEEWNHFADLIEIAQWDSRNGGIGCEGHHRRFDGHLTPPLIVPESALPGHVREFIADYGFETETERRFPEQLRLPHKVRT